MDLGSSLQHDQHEFSYCNLTRPRPSRGTDQASLFRVLALKVVFSPAERQKRAVTSRFWHPMRHLFGQGCTKIGHARCSRRRCRRVSIEWRESSLSTTKLSEETMSMLLPGQIACCKGKGSSNVEKPTTMSPFENCGNDDSHVEPSRNATVVVAANSPTLPRSKQRPCCLLVDKVLSFVRSDSRTFGRPRLQTSAEDGADLAGRTDFGANKA